MALAEIRVIDNEITIEVEGASLLAPLVSAATAAQAGAEAALATMQADIDLYLDGFTDTEVVGRAVDPVTGTGVAAGTYAHASPVVHDSIMKAVRAFGLGSGTLKVKVFTGAVGSLTQVGADIDVTITAGAVNYTLPAPVSVPAGARIGFYTPAGLITYTANAADGTGWYNQSGGTNVTTVTDSTTTTNPRLEMGVDLSFVYLDRDVYEETVETVASTGVTLERIRTDYILGLPITPTSGTSAASNYTLTYYDTVPVTGQITSLTLYSAAGGTVKVKVYRGALGSLVRQGTDATLTAAVGLNTFTISPPLDVQAGDRLGLYGQNAGTLVYTTAAGDNGGLLEKSGDADTVEDTTPLLTARLQAAITIRYVPDLPDIAGRADTGTRLLFGITKPIKLVGDGNSLMIGQGVLRTENFLSQLATTLAVPRVNFGVAGQQTPAMASDAGTQVDPEANADYYNVLFGLEIYNHMWIGHASLSDAIDAIDDYFADRRAAGVWDKLGLIMLPDLEPVATWFPAGSVATVNAALRARSNPSWDFLVQTDLVPGLMDRFSTTSHQSDRIHLTKAGYTMLANRARIDFCNHLLGL